MLLKLFPALGRVWLLIFVVVRSLWVEVVFFCCCWEIELVMEDDVFMTYYVIMINLWYMHAYVHLQNEKLQLFHT